MMKVALCFVPGTSSVLDCSEGPVFASLGGERAYGGLHALGGPV